MVNLFTVNLKPYEATQNAKFYAFAIDFMEHRGNYYIACSREQELYFTKLAKHSHGIQ